MELGISQTELGQRAGVSQQTVARWENGGPPSFGRLENLATALAMEQRDLMVAAGEVTNPAAPNSREPLHALVGALPTMPENELLTILELTTRELKKRINDATPA
jgi:transcriptional regulator with XRE-family HTH domain